MLGEDVVIAGVRGNLLGSGFLLNLRDFRSEALVLGNCTTVCFKATAELVASVSGVWVSLTFTRGFSFTGPRLRFAAEVPGITLRRRFFRGRGSFVLVDTGDDDNADIC